LLKGFNVFRVKYFIFIISGILLIRCSNKQSENRINSVRTVGKYHRDLETGLWQSFDQSNKLLEKGYFVNGLRTGIWQYYTPIRDSIIWNKFINLHGRIITNVPNFFELRDNEDSIVFFKYYDTSKIFNLVIAKGEINGIKTFAKYEKQLYADLQDRNIKIIDTASQYLETKLGYRYFYNKIWGVLPHSDTLVIYNIAYIDNQQKIIEVSVRSEKTYVEKAQVIFFSVIPNLFIDSARFLDKRDIITKIK